MPTMINKKNDAACSMRNRPGEGDTKRSIAAGTLLRPAEQTDGRAERMGDQKTQVG